MSLVLILVASAQVQAGMVADGQTFNQVPQGVGVRITNAGNQPINISYWNGRDAWESASLAAAKVSTIRCSACGSMIRIAFDDGHSTRTVDTTLGTDYLMYWSEQASAWDLKPEP